MMIDKEIIKPMAPKRSQTIPEDKDWIHEIKWDGIRGIAQINHEEVSIYTKKGNPRINYYPELLSLSQCITCDEATLDGEIIALNADDKPSFQDILIREKKGERDSAYMAKVKPVHYIVFDCLSVNGEDLRGEPLYKRKEILKDIFKENEYCALTPYYSNGKELYERMKEKGYEGIVSKKIESPYIAGKKHSDWYKIKISRKMLVAVGGLHIKEDVPISMVVGIRKDNQWICVGRVAIGLRKNELLMIYNHRDRLATKECPFVNIQESNNEKYLWLQPLLTCWVHFMEWTNDGSMRHPKMLGFANLKPEEATGEELVE